MTPEWLVAEYSAGASYVSTLIQVRFTVAGFYVAFLGFLATVNPPEFWAYVFGVAVTVLVIALELRTTRLLSHAFDHLAGLENLVQRGEVKVETEKTADASNNKVEPMTFFTKLPDGKLLSHKLVFTLYVLGGIWMVWRLFQVLPKT